jgi:hypothetical protein
MKLILTYILALGLGVLVAFGIASLIGLVFPVLKIWVFLIISVSWLYIGWKYAIAQDKIRATARDMGNQTRIPEGCDYILARDEIAEFFAIANRQAEKEGGRYVFQKEMVNAWYSFRDNPCADTANALLRVTPTLYQYFEACSPGGQFYINKTILKK